MTRVAALLLVAALSAPAHGEVILRIAGPLRIETGGRRHPRPRRIVGPPDPPGTLVAPRPHVFRHVRTPLAQSEGWRALGGNMGQWLGRTRHCPDRRIRQDAPPRRGVRPAPGHGRLRHLDHYPHPGRKRDPSHFRRDREWRHGQRPGSPRARRRRRQDRSDQAVGERGIYSETMAARLAARYRRRCPGRGASRRRGRRDGGP